jgi:hypothetical protein
VNQHHVGSHRADHGSKHEPGATSNEGRSELGCCLPSEFDPFFHFTIIHLDREKSFANNLLRRILWIPAKRKNGSSAAETRQQWRYLHRADPLRKQMSSKRSTLLPRSSATLAKILPSSNLQPRHLHQNSMRVWSRLRPAHSVDGHTYTCSWPSSSAYLIAAAHYAGSPRHTSKGIR